MKKKSPEGKLSLFMKFLLFCLSLLGDVETGLKEYKERIDNAQK